MTAQPQQLIIRRPDDWHIHLRDDEMLRAVLPRTSAVCGRAIVMPNLAPPVTSVEAAIAYRERILAALPEGHAFQPLMTCYLTDSLSADEVEKGSALAFSPPPNSIPLTPPPTPATASPASMPSLRCWSGCSASACRC